LKEKKDYYKDKSHKCSAYVVINSRPWGVIDARICKGCVHFTGKTTPYECELITGK